MASPVPARWDEETDVVVVGYGFAGALTAIAAHDAGARALILEKEEHFGGISITSGGGLAIARSEEKALDYLRATCAGRTPDDILRVFAHGLFHLTEWVEELAHAVDADVNYEGVDSTACYPLPGSDAIGSVKIAWMETFGGFPWMRGLRGGARLFKVVADNVQLRGIPVRLGTPGRELVRDEAGRIAGVIAEHAGRRIAIAARRAVVLAAGGFENNDEMKRNYFQAMPVHPVTALGNTGDGIAMAQDAGADLWHMWHFHGGYGFKFDEFPFAFRHHFSGPRQDHAGQQLWTDNLKTVMPWILVDHDGRRFMNEYPPVPQDTGARPLEFFDPDRQEFPRIPCYLIFDEQAIAQGPVAFPIFTDPRYDYEWSGDNSREIERGWILRADSLAGLAERLRARGRERITAAGLQATLDRWNELVRAGRDVDFLRPQPTMCAIEGPTLYAMEAWPIVSNTQGGPRHDARQRVLDTAGRPIPGLYAAGECGSIFGHLYLESGNVSECFIGGRVAGREAAAEPARDR